MKRIRAHAVTPELFALRMSMPVRCRPRARPGHARAHALFVGALAGALGAGCTGGFQAPAVPSPADIPALEAERRARPADPDLRVRLGAAYRAADRLDEARAVLEEVLADTGDEGAVWFLGLTYEELGADSAALALYRRYVDEGGDAQLRSELEDRIPLVRRRLLRDAVRGALAREAELADVEAPPGTIAVFPFAYLGEDPELAPLGRALAQMLTTDLSQTDRLVVLERLRAQALLDELALVEQQVVDPATAARGGRLLGASRIVQGQLDTEGDEVLVEARVVGGSPGAPVSEGAVQGRDRLQGLLELEKVLALDIYRTMGIELTPAERERVTRNRTESVEALVAFGLGLEAQDAGRYQEARDHFSRAATLDPSFEAARIQLADSEALASAAGTALDALGDLGASLLAATATPEDLAQHLIAIELLVPGLLERDPLAEILQREGFVPGTTTLDLILRRPGGGDR